MEEGAGGFWALALRRVIPQPNVPMATPGQGFQLQFYHLVTFPVSLYTSLQLKSLGFCLVPSPAETAPRPLGKRFSVIRVSLASSHRCRTK